MSWAEAMYIIEVFTEKLDKIEEELREIKEKLQIEEE